MPSSQRWWGSAGLPCPVHLAGFHMPKGAFSWCPDTMHAHIGSIYTTSSQVCCLRSDLLEAINLEPCVGCGQSEVKEETHYCSSLFSSTAMLQIGANVRTGRSDAVVRGSMKQARIIQAPCSYCMVVPDRVWGSMSQYSAGTADSSQRPAPL